MADTYKLTASDVPGRRTHSIYADILREFVENGEASMLVQVEDKKPQTVRAGLRTAIKQEGSVEASTRLSAPEARHSTVSGTSWNSRSCRLPLEAPTLMSEN